MCFLVYLFKANQNPPISEPFPITLHDSVHAGYFSQNNKSEGSFAPPTSELLHTHSYYVFVTQLSV